ncbi:MAG: hypothetical protein ABIP90_07350, partial [Vicinamibacterales bacterium]
MSASRRDLWLIPALVLLSHIVVLQGYGWFRDEFYYLQCAAHLDYGYVDHPALSILPLWLVRATVGATFSRGRPRTASRTAARSSPRRICGVPAGQPRP